MLLFETREPQTLQTTCLSTISKHGINPIDLAKNSTVLIKEIAVVSILTEKPPVNKSSSNNKFRVIEFTSSRSFGVITRP